jgi:hypothetical protein
MLARLATRLPLRGTSGQVSDVLHHVMGRGIERKRLFIDKRDRQDFNTRLPALAFEKLYTFCTNIP